MALPPGRYGYVAIMKPGKPTIERDAYLCAHCQMLCIVRPGSGTTRGYCFRCQAPLCGRAPCNQRCIPFEAKMEAQEGRRRFWKQMELTSAGEASR